MHSLTNEQIARVFAMYYGCEFIYEGWTESREMLYPTECPTSCKLLLTPLSFISDKDALAICHAAAPAVFGDYRFDKWKVVDRENYDDTYIKIGRKRTEEYFTINKISGDVIFWDGDTRDIEDSYYTEYFRLGIAVPLTIEAGHLDNGKTAIELGLAVDKITLKN